jgi:hypothetical protein
MLCHVNGPRSFPFARPFSIWQPARWLLLVAGFALAVSLPTATAQDKEKQPQDVPLVKYEIDDELQTVGIAALDGQGGSKKLTAAEDGASNTTIVRIDGKDVEFGSPDGKLEMKAVALGKDAKGNPRPGVKTVWSYGKIRITQVVEIVRSRTKRLDSCLISYQIENQDNKEHQVGIRAMVDTLVDDNDGAPFAVAGKKEIITTSADFAKAMDVPAHIDVLQKADLANPGLVGRMTFKVGGKLEAPGRVILTHWPGGANKELDWDVPVADINDDSCVVMYWNPTTVRANAQRDVGYAYGLGVVELPAAKEK